MGFSRRLDRILEGMGATEYVPPQQPYQLMADFYLVQFMQAPVGKRGQTLSQRAEELLRDLQYVERQLLPALREHLLVMAGYAILGELQHAWVHASFATGQNRARVTALLRHLGMSERLVKQLEPDEEEGEPELEPEQFTLQDYLEGARAGATAFAEGRPLLWRTDYGGPPWQQACRAWLGLYSAHTLPEMARYIDLLYSLQHNTGALLNKNPEYDGPWLRVLLDLKFKAREPEELLPYASSYMRRLVPQLIRALYGRSLHPDYRGKSRRWDAQAYEQVLQQLARALEERGYKTERGSIGDLVVWHRTPTQDLHVASVVPALATGALAVIDYTGTSRGYNDRQDISIDDHDLIRQMIERIDHLLRRAHRR